MDNKTYTIELSAPLHQELLTILRTIGLKDHDTMREIMNQPHWREAVSCLHGKASTASVAPEASSPAAKEVPPAKDASPEACIFSIQLTPGRRNQLSTILNAIRAGDGRALGEMSNDVQWRNVSRQLLLAIDRADDAVWDLLPEKHRLEELTNAVALLRGFVAEQKPKNTAERAIIRDWESSLKELAKAAMDSWPGGAAGTEAPQSTATLTPDQRARVILLIERTRDAVAHKLPASYLWSKDLIEIRDVLGGGPGASETPKASEGHRAMCLVEFTPATKSRLMALVDTALRSGGSVANPMELVDAWNALAGSGVTAPAEQLAPATPTLLYASDGDELYNVRLTLFQKHLLLDLCGDTRARRQGKVPSTLAERSVSHDENQKLNELTKAIHNSEPEGPKRTMVEMKNGWAVYTYKRPSAVGQPAPFTPDMATMHLEKAKRALSPDGRIQFDFPVTYVVLGGQAYILPDEGVREES